MYSTRKLSPSPGERLQDVSTFLHAVLGYVEAPLSPLARPALLTAMDETSAIAQAATVGMHPHAFRMRRRAARRTLHTWTEEVRSAAAD